MTDKTAAHVEETRSRPVSRRQDMMSRLAPATLAAAVLLSAVVLPKFMFHQESTLAAPGLGPGAWPGGVMALLAIFALIWLGMELFLLARGRRSTTLSAPHDEDVYHYRTALIGIILVLAYGWLMPIVGFGLATIVFLIVWCLYGGIRNIWVLVLVPILGTVGLLWMFMGMALMPLPRGQGLFEQISVSLLQLTGIY